MSALNVCCYVCQVVLDIVSVTTINLSFPLQAYMCSLNQEDTVRKTLKDPLCMRNMKKCVLYFSFNTVCFNHTL